MTAQVSGVKQYADGSLVITGTVNGASVTAAGSSQATCTVVGTGLNVVGSADGTKGITLFAGQPGDECIVFNNAASTCPVYPPVGAAICVPGTGLGSANAAFSLLTYKTGQFNCISSTQWLVIVTA